MITLENTREDALNAAVWVTCSEHEWVWTKDQQIAMARFCILANVRIRELENTIKELKK